MLCYSRADLAQGKRLPNLSRTKTHRISTATGEGVQELLHLLAAEIKELEAKEGRSFDLLRALDAEALAAESGVDPNRWAFADRVDRGIDLGPTPWPRRPYFDEPALVADAARPDAAGEEDAR